MDRTKYIGMDVHQASISIAVRDASGKLVIESFIETKAATILEFSPGIEGNFVGSVRGAMSKTVKQGEAPSEEQKLTHRPSST